VFSHVGATRAFNQNFLTFNSLNSFILKGDGAQGMELTFASLMVRAQDEPDALYGLAARAVQLSPDGLCYRFLLRPGIKFHDGNVITAYDIAFSLEILKNKGHPIIQQLLRDFIGAEAPNDATVEVRFAPHVARDVPLFVAALPIFSRGYYLTHRFDETSSKYRSAAALTKSAVSSRAAISNMSE
jgi:microcin C transport system substrate-binding protein